MRVSGEWFESEDGIFRPTVRAFVHGIGDLVVRERFLIDTGADRTVFNAGLFQRLRLIGDQPPPGLDLVGVGSSTKFLVTRTALELTGDDGRPAIIRGEFAAFTDSDATAVSILGRDVLDNFRLIVSRLDGDVFLLASSHHYQVIQS